MGISGDVTFICSKINEILLCSQINYMMTEILCTSISSRGPKSFQLTPIYRSSVNTASACHIEMPQMFSLQVG